MYNLSRFAGGVIPRLGRFSDWEDHWSPTGPLRGAAIPAPVPVPGTA
jgi:hypothetical protein